MSFSSAPQVELQTSIGNFVVELYVKHAPKTCKNFRELARRGYYNNTIVSLRLVGILQVTARLTHAILPPAVSQNH